MLESIDAQTIYIIRVDQVFDPLVQFCYDGGVFGVDIRQREILVTQPALFYVCLIIVVADEALGMKLRRDVEGRGIRVVDG